VVGLPLGGRVGGVLVIPLGLTPGLCLGISGPPIGLLRVALFDLVVGFDAVAGTRLGHRIALAVGHRAIRTSCREGRSFFVGHVGQTVNHRACCAGSWPIPVHGGHLACPKGCSCGLNALVASRVDIRSVDRRAFCAGGRPIPGRGGHMACCEAAPAASTLLWRPLPPPRRSHGILRSHPVISRRLQPPCCFPRQPGQTRRQLSISRWRPAHPWPMRPFGAS
jgi:hypothetical protein